MKAQTIARELALLALPQLSKAQKKLAQSQPRELQLTLEEMMLNAIATLREETQEALEAAAAELQRSTDRLLNSQTRASDVNSARVMTADAIALVQTAIDRLGHALEMPESINNFNRPDVRSYALQLLVKATVETDNIDTLLSKSLVDWQLGRLPKIDRDDERSSASVCFGNDGAFERFARKRKKEGLFYSFQSHKSTRARR